MDELERRKLDSLKELAYGASHEINNPLANIAARAQALLRDEPHPDRRRTLEAIHQQALRAHEMISDLMLFARPPQPVFESLDLNELVAEIANGIGAEAEHRRIELTITLPNQATIIRGDRQQLWIAVRAVGDNALEAVGTDGKVALTVSILGDMAQIELADTGPGISPEIREHLFDPFFSGREAGRGLGFGLSKCWRIVTEHGGSISVASHTGPGAVFSIALPISGPRAQ